MIVLKRYSRETRVPEIKPADTPERYIGVSLKKEKKNRSSIILRERLDYISEDRKNNPARPFLVGDLFVNYQGLSAGVRNPIRAKAKVASHPKYSLEDNTLFSFLSRGKLITLHDVSFYWNPYWDIRRGTFNKRVFTEASKQIEKSRLPNTPSFIQYLLDYLPRAYKRASVMEFYRIWWATMRYYGRWDIVKQQNDKMAREILRQHPFHLYLSYLADLDSITEHLETNKALRELALPYTIRDYWSALIEWLTRSYVTARLGLEFIIEDMQYVYPPDFVPDDIIIRSLQDHIASPLPPLT